MIISEKTISIFPQILTEFSVNLQGEIILSLAG